MIVLLFIALVLAIFVITMLAVSAAKESETQDRIALELPRILGELENLKDEVEKLKRHKRNRR